MKVLQINKYHYLKGGSDKMYLQISQLLESKGHQVVHFSTKAPENAPSSSAGYFVEDPGFLNQTSGRQLTSAFRYIYSQESRRKLERLIVAERPDIAHLHIFFGELSLAILPVLKKHGIPVVMSLHDYKFLCPVYTLLDQNTRICERCATGNYWHAVIKRCSKKSLAYSSLAALESFVRDRFIPYESYIDHFLAVSRFSMEKHLKYRKGIADKTSYLYNFIHADPGEMNPGTHQDYYLYFGRLSREKGLFTLIRAFSGVRHFQLVIAGEGPEGDSLRKYCKEHHLSNVTFVGYRKGKALRQLIASAKFTIVPSEWYESFGLGVIESMALGTPVIASRIGGMQELVMHEQTGYFFEPGNVHSLLQIIQKTAVVTANEYLRMSRRGHDFASHFSAESFYRQLIALYQEIIRMHQEKQKG